MSRFATFAILGVLLVVLGAMSYVIERAGKPDAPKIPPQQQEAAQKQAMKQRIEQEAASRKRMMTAIKARAGVNAGQKPGPGRQRPVAGGVTEPEKPKNTLPAGALDISEDWFKKRQPGQQGIKELEKQSSQSAPPVVPPPSLAATRGTK